MTIERGFEIETGGIELGKKAVCLTCPHTNLINRLLWFGQRESGKQLPKHEANMVEIAAQLHEEETQGKHRIAIWTLVHDSRYNALGLNRPSTKTRRVRG